ncbi:MAG: transposase [Planctomycetes bacterium]|nr:transposase [Planctomycetota bacterium]
MPEGYAFFTEYDMYALIRAGCGASRLTELLCGIPAGCAGAHLQAALRLLTGRHRLGRRYAGELIAARFGEKAASTDGTIVEFEWKTSEALKPAYEEALEAVRKAEETNVHETNCRIKGRKPWLGVAAAALIVVIRIDKDRSKAAWHQFLGGFSGILCTDRYEAYAGHALHLRQCCWSHLKRAIKALVDASAAAVGVDRWSVKPRPPYCLWYNPRRPFP